MGISEHIVQGIKRCIRYSRGYVYSHMSEKPKRTIVAVFGVLAIAGCQVAVQDPASPQQIFKVDGPGQGCLEATLPVIQGYFAGQTSPKELSDSWDCLTGALEMFTTFTQGENTQAYSGQELRIFLERHFLGDLRLSDEFLTEVMRLKQAFLGGSLDTVTRSELTRAQFVLRVFKTETLRLLPHIPVLTMTVSRDEAQKNPNAVETALAQFSSSIETFGGLLGQSRSPYELSHFSRLLREFEKLYTGSTDWGGPDWIIERLPAAAALKAFFIRPNGNAIAPDEWQPLVSYGGRLFSLYLRAHYLIFGRDALSGDGLDQLTILSNEVINLLEVAVDSKPGKLITYKVIDHLIDEVFGIMDVNLDLKSETVKSAVRLVLDRVFNPAVSFGQTVVRVPINGLGERNLHEIRQTTLGFLEMQRLWRVVSAQLPTQTLFETGGAIPLSEIRKRWPHLATPYRRQFEDLNHIFQQNAPYSFSKHGTVILHSNIMEHAFDQSSFLSLNWKQMVVRLLIQGFSASPGTHRFSGLSRDEVKNLYDEVRQLAIELGALAPDDTDFWESLFMESNLFMLSGDANDWLSFSEATELVSLALGNTYYNDAIYADLIAHCEKYDPDVFGDPRIKAGCMRQRMRARFMEFFDLLPEWKKMVRNYDEDDFGWFQYLWEVAARESGASGVPIERADLTRMTMVIHYIESVFVRFDTNRNGVITMKEADAMYPLLKGLLKEASGLDDNMLRPLFAYLLRYGRAPETIKEKLYFQFIWSRQEKNWNIQANRLKIMSIIGAINKAAAEGQSVLADAASVSSTDAGVPIPAPEEFPETSADSQNQLPAY